LTEYDEAYSKLEILKKQAALEEEANALVHRNNDTIFEEELLKVIANLDKLIEDYSLWMNTCITRD